MMMHYKFADADVIVDSSFRFCSVNNENIFFCFLHISKSCKNQKHDSEGDYTQFWVCFTHI